MLLTVSIHAPAWGATIRSRRLSFMDCFNSRARMGRDSFDSGAKEYREVSIHAPAWGATLIRCNGRRQFPVSIHAPAWGATSDNCSSVGRWRVSIHAPAWGATVRPRRQHLALGVSIHAPAWGATSAGQKKSTNELFQFTRPHGARRVVCVIWPPPGSFNSRARMGRDVVVFCFVADPLVSIHAPAWGATSIRGIEV